ncbi:MAG TPA: uracil-DNA glycosylase, partial [Synergistaceae bacterium]|nr:uracil-DNA glycosylase [Synergistaceae bacterium]
MDLLYDPEGLEVAKERGRMWEALEREAESCARCPLGAGRHRVVLGDGNRRSSLLLVGEGPGAEEDAQGIPFVGAAGQLLTKILEAAGIGRQEVYITNIVKCRPPNNR